MIPILQIFGCVLLLLYKNTNSRKMSEKVLMLFGIAILKLFLIKICSSMLFRLQQANMHNYKKTQVVKIMYEHFSILVNKTFFMTFYYE